MIDLPSPALIGMVHVPALPGTPLHVLSMEEIVARCVADARVLAEAGFGALFVENFGDRPFAAERVEPASIAGLAVVVTAVRQAVGLPVGVNVLRNDAAGALGVAAACGARFVRVNVHVGVAATDQGVITGRADATLRYRKQLGARVAVFADVHVKHATPISTPDLAEAARETAYRGLADALIVSGPATGSPVELSHLDVVRQAVPDRRLFVGSGATAATVRELLTRATGVIVGTALKRDGDVDQPVDPERARAFVAAARGGSAASHG